MVERRYATEHDIVIGDSLVIGNEKFTVVIDEYFNFEISNLRSFLKAGDNPRIMAVANDQVLNKYGGLIAGAIGCMIGFVSIGGSTIMGSCYEYFSIPNMESVYPAYLIVYGLVLPPAISALVNWIVIRRKLNRPALQMLKNEQNSRRMKQIQLGKMNFVRAFRIRQIIREARTSLMVVGGIFISLLILMLGLNCFCMCQHVSEDYKEDTKYINRQ